MDKVPPPAAIHLPFSQVVESVPDSRKGLHPMTNPVLENIRRSVARTPQLSSPQETTPSLRPDILKPRLPESMDSEIERFLSEVNKLSGKAEKLQPSDIASALQTLVAEQNIRKATVWNTPLLNQLQITTHLSSLGVEIISPNADKHSIAQCDLGVTETDCLLPETGTLVLRSSAEKPRAVSLAPRVHLAIVQPSMLRPDMHQVFAEAKDSHYLVFITGPSRTADIELTVTLGVHGPKNLYVWMMDT
jgi:L-lactate dehydrogenase complex protein LldG